MGLFTVATSSDSRSSLADLAGSKRDASYSQKELSHERQQKSMLQSKVDTLKTRVAMQKKEMLELEGDAKEKLTSAGSHMKQTRNEVSALKAKVRQKVAGCNDF